MVEKDFTLQMNDLYKGVFKGLSVLLTGHTGFKGSWLTLWLKAMGANVIGYSLPEPPTIPSNFEISKIGKSITDLRGDIRDYEALRGAIERHKPELVIHFAAQTTVLPSYEQPKLSLDINVGGTINVLEAIRTTDSVKAVVVCTTDKVYENKEWIWGYRENDELGGYDPYSTGKAMAELAVTSYRRSFFSGLRGSSKRNPAVGSVRAGNVIGGGDFTENGLLADSMRSIVKRESIYLRNPSSTRPWQYVLEPLSGYLCLAEKLLIEGQEYAQAWNFGPLQHTTITTLEVVKKLVDLWNDEHVLIEYDEAQRSGKLHEAHNLHLNWDKSASLLEWRPVFTINEALSETVKWYEAYRQGDDMYAVCNALLKNYVKAARGLKLGWTCE
jgi:CDP-glucose 4,6-dehydratase